MKMGTLRYDKDADPWVFDTQAGEVHKGEALEFKIGNRYVFGLLGHPPYFSALGWHRPVWY
jgi:hypothetical protein